MRKRNHVIPVRLNAKELRHLDEQVKRSGLNREEFLRSLILGVVWNRVICPVCSRLKKMFLYYKMQKIQNAV